jgi:hypothetical protein
LKLDRVEPVLLTVSEKPLPSPSIIGPRAAHLGEMLEYRIAPGAGGRGVLHLDVVGPEGATIADYSGNVFADHAGAVRVLPLAFNDKTGAWKIQMRDLLSGATATAELQVEP